jgi:hypothetical protein
LVDVVRPDFLVRAQDQRVSHLVLFSQATVRRKRAMKRFSKHSFSPRTKSSFRFRSPFPPVVVVAEFETSSKIIPPSPKLNYSFRFRSPPSPDPQSLNVEPSFNVERTGTNWRKGDGQEGNSFATLNEGGKGEAKTVVSFGLGWGRGGVVNHMIERFLQSL